MTDTHNFIDFFYYFEQINSQKKQEWTFLGFRLLNHGELVLEICQMNVIHLVLVLQSSRKDHVTPKENVDQRYMMKFPLLVPQSYPFCDFFYKNIAGGRVPFDLHSTSTLLWSLRDTRCKKSRNSWIDPFINGYYHQYSSI